MLGAHHAAIGQGQLSTEAGCDLRAVGHHDQPTLMGAIEFQQQFEHLIARLGIEISGGFVREY